jgi:thiol:disulfide interchange protein DsbD
VITLDRGNAYESARLSVEARYQGCSEKGLCYPPAKKNFDLTLAAWQPGAAMSGPPGSAGTTALHPQQGTADQRAALNPPQTVTSSRNDGAIQNEVPSSNEASSPQNETSKVARLFKSGNFWLIVASFFGAGLLLSFTPCVFHGAHLVWHHRWARASNIARLSCFPSSM